MILRFEGGAVLRPAGLDDGPLTLLDGRVGADDDGAAGAIPDELVDLEGGYLLPGFIDTQVNGGGDVLFNDRPNVAGIAAIGAAHRAFGTTAFLPTLISDELDVVDAAMRAAEQAIAEGVPGVVGIHLEGPFLNPARKGTHDAARFKRLDAGSIALLGSLKRGRTLVTLAPEMTTAEDIAALRRRGVIVAAGHTDADHATMRAAFGAGVTGVTHLYNAMSPLAHRAPGVVGATLDDQEAYVGVIVDGAHVDPAALRIAMRARPRDRFMLVSDAMPTVGSATKQFILQGRSIRVVNGVCVGEGGTLAGSDLDMTTAVRNAVSMIGLSVAEAGVMAASAPAAFLDLADRGILAPGRRGDLVWLDRDLRLRAVWLAGQRQQPREARQSFSVHASGSGPAT